MAVRSKYQGVAEIIDYNRGFYLATLAAALAGFGLSFLLPLPLRTVVILSLAAAVLWMGMSLLVSHWVYDRSSLYSLTWLHLNPPDWVNIHAGLDQTTALLAAKLPASRYRVFDVFDPAQMTEPSIERARKVSGRVSQTRPAEPARWSHLPAASASIDAVFLLFAAHEFRQVEARHTFFREVARLLRSGGRVVLVEHLRDLWNLLAYGPGCLHFQPRSAWETAFEDAGLVIHEERRLTPFVHIFELRLR